MAYRKLVLAAAGLLAGAIAITACSEVKVPTATPRVFEPTPAASEAAAVQPTASSTNTAVAPTATRPAARAAGATPTRTPTPVPPQKTAAGDPERGRQLYSSNACTGCHSTGSDRILGPGHQGVAERAATRVSGLTADEYMRQSLTEPGAHVVEDFANLMPSFAHLPEADLDDLIAFMKSLK